MRNSVFVAGHRGMVGSAICRRLQSERSPPEILTASRSELDLLDSSSVQAYFSKHKPIEVYIAAAKVGGIFANSKNRVGFLFENMMIQNNILWASYKNNVKKVLFLGSSCIYPKHADHPIKEESLLTGALEQTNEPYAIAKISGLKLCEAFNREFDKDFRALMPTNLYGPSDNFNSESSHVIPGLLHRFHVAKIRHEKSVTVWGSGEPLREFLFVEDLADACVFIMGISKEKLSDVLQENVQFLNVGSGDECRIKDLSLLIAEIVGYSGDIKFDPSRPDGTPRKLIDSSKLNSLGWTGKTRLAEGLEQTYSWYLDNQELIRK